MTRFGWTFCPGDKVMQVENDYDKDVYNADLGVVSRIDIEEGEPSSTSTSKAARLPIAFADELVLAYATTIHKSQGIGIPGCGDHAQHSALSDAAAEPRLHGGDARQALGGARRAAKGTGDRPLRERGLRGGGPSCGSGLSAVVRQARRSRELTDIYVDGDACPVREETYRVAVRLGLNVFVVSNGSRPIRPPGLSKVSMVPVGDNADAADDWIAEHISAANV